MTRDRLAELLTWPAAVVLGVGLVAAAIFLYPTDSFGWTPTGHFIIREGRVGFCLLCLGLGGACLADVCGRVRRAVWARVRGRSESAGS